MKPLRASPRPLRFIFFEPLNFFPSRSAPSGLTIQPPDRRADGRSWHGGIFKSPHIHYRPAIAVAVQGTAVSILVERRTVLVCSRVYTWRPRLEMKVRWAAKARIGADIPLSADGVTLDAGVVGNRRIRYLGIIAPDDAVDNYPRTLIETSPFSPSRVAVNGVVPDRAAAAIESADEEIIRARPERPNGRSAQRLPASCRSSYARKRSIGKEV